MRITASRAAWLLAGAMLSISTPCSAQTQGLPAGNLSIAGEVGPRSYTSMLDPLAIGKFEEYRDLRARNRTSVLFEQMFVQFTPSDSFAVYSLSARKLFDLDQSAWLLAKRPGQYDFQLRWDRIPHTYSTTARSPGNELGNPGFNPLPAPRPDSNAWRSGTYIGPVRNQVDPVKATLAVTPNANLDFKADFTHIGKSGGIPRSVSFSGSSGPQREYVSPIDQTINDARVSQGYASGDRSPNAVLPFIKSYQVNVAYAYSRFENAIKSTMVDNPQLSLSSFTNGTSSARVSLEPSNSAQTAAANAAILLPMRTRVMGAVTSSWARQNDPFFPQTSNDSLSRDPNYALVSSYIRPSLDGRVRTSTYTFSATTHPVAKLSVVGRYRNFDLSNQTAPFGIRAMIVSDRTVTLADSEKFEAHPFTKTNTNVGATYLLTQGLALSAGYAWEDWKRDPAVRNIEKTSETSPRVSIDYTALNWFSLRTSYTMGSRRGNTPYTEAATEILNFRRFDEADRDRTRLAIAASVMPIDQVTVGLTFETGNDKFPNSQYGVQSDKSIARGVDVDWSPTPRFSASAGWMLEDVKDSANYRYRTGAVGSVTFDNASYRWMNTNKDKNTTMFANFNANIIKGKLDLAGTWSLIDAQWQMFNVNPTTPTGGTAAQNLNATAQDWPEVSQRLEPMSLGLRYTYSRDWAMTFRYQAEKYSQTDFRTVAPVFTTTGLNGAPPLSVGFSPGDLPGTIGQVAGSNTGQYHFLGNNYHPYTANWFTLLITYQPALIPFAKGRSTF
jgi:MtrB/PioB family decaheme-associated outer membrane protein